MWEKTRTGKNTHTKHIRLTSHAMNACKRLIALLPFIVRLSVIWGNAKVSAFQFDLACFFLLSFLSATLFLDWLGWSRSAECIIFTWLNQMLKNSTPIYVTCWCLMSSVCQHFCHFHCNNELSERKNAGEWGCWKGNKRRIEKESTEFREKRKQYLLFKQKTSQACFIEMFWKSVLCV